MDFRLAGRGKFAPVQKLARSESSLQQADHSHRSKKVRMPSRDLSYTVKKVSDIPVPSRDVTCQTLPGREYSFYYRPGRVWLVTSRLGTGMSLTFFYSVGDFFDILNCFPLGYTLLKLTRDWSTRVSFYSLWTGGYNEISSISADQVRGGGVLRVSANEYRTRIFKLLRTPRIDSKKSSASLCSLAGRYTALHRI